jgi:hypothetical protein
VRPLRSSPPRAAATRVRVLATNDLLATVVPPARGHAGAGTLDGVAALVERERERGPVLWLDSGDFTGGPAWALLGDRGWSVVAGLPIDAAVAGNHEFDEGPEALRTAVGGLGFPVLGANVDAGLTPATLVDTADGADRVVVLQHDGVDWWPSAPGDPDAVRTRADRWTTGATWSGEVDLVLGGHTLGAWAGRVGATPFGHAHPMAASVLVVDLTSTGVQVRGAVTPPPAPPGSPDRRRVADRLGAAAAEVIGWNPRPWSTAAGTGEDYLPDRVAAILRQHAGCDAAFLPAHCFFTQAPLDGVVAHLAAGAVTALDPYRLFAFPDDGIAVVEVAAGELERLRERHDAVASPRSRAGDGEWWNWARTRAGVATGGGVPRTVAVPGHTVPLVETWLGRAVRPVATVRARAALRAWFAR